MLDGVVSYTPIRRTDGTPGIDCPFMSSEQVIVGPVELSYTLTEEDWLDGFVAHRPTSDVPGWSRY